MGHLQMLLDRVASFLKILALPGQKYQAFDLKNIGSYNNNHNKGLTLLVHEHFAH